MIYWVLMVLIVQRDVLALVESKVSSFYGGTLLSLTAILSLLYVAIVNIHTIFL